MNARAMQLAGGHRGARTATRRPASRFGARRVPLVCLAVFSVVWIALAIAPRYRADWLLENLLTFVAVPVLVLGYRRRPLSDRSYVQITLVLLLHTLGSHYTYSEVPAGDWARDALGLARNHYDRLVHLAFGALGFRPARELFVGPSPGDRPSRRELYLTFAVIASWSLLYELLEWVVAITADPAAGTAYLGTQGDEWDAQKDMALAAGGALAAAAWEARRGVR
jgi:putative membrane protein